MKFLLRPLEYSTGQTDLVTKKRLLKFHATECNRGMGGECGSNDYFYYSPANSTPDPEPKVESPKDKQGSPQNVRRSTRTRYKPLHYDSSDPRDPKLLE